MEANTIFDLEGTVIAAFNRGVAWSRTGHGRLGHIDSPLDTEGGVYDNEGNRVASFKEGVVQSPEGQLLGRFQSDKNGHRLFLPNGDHIGKCIGSHGSAAAAIVFWSRIK